METWRCWTLRPGLPARSCASTLDRDRRPTHRRIWRSSLGDVLEQQTLLRQLCLQLRDDVLLLCQLMLQPLLLYHFILMLLICHGLVNDNTTLYQRDVYLKHIGLRLRTVSNTPRYCKCNVPSLWLLDCPPVDVPSVHPGEQSVPCTVCAYPSCMPPLRLLSLLRSSLSLLQALQLGSPI